MRKYRDWINKSIFRQLNIWISMSLLFIFIMLGILTYSNFFDLIQNREQELLNYRTQKVYDDLLQSIEQFKRTTASLYVTEDPYDQKSVSSLFLPSNIPPDENEYDISLKQQNTLTQFLKYAAYQNPNASDFSFFRTGDRKLFQVGKSNYNNVDVNLWNRFYKSAVTKIIPSIGVFDNFPSIPNYSMIYFISPIFDINSLLTDPGYGYFMMTIDPGYFYRFFNEDSSSMGRLIIYHDQKVLMDSLIGEPLPVIENNKNKMVQTLTSINNDLTVIGIKDNNEIKKNLIKIIYEIILILLFSWFVCILLIYYIQRVSTKRLHLLMSHFKKIQQDPFVQPLQISGNDEISFLVTRFNQMTLQLQEYIQNITTISIQKHNAEYYALKMQINPHFLYNTLESLRMQAVILDQPILGERLFMLGKLFRWILKTEDEIITIEEELRYTQYYLDLFNLGKSNRINLEIESEYDLTEHYLLKFSLQPIIENAIQHGDLENTNHPTLFIRIYIEDQFQIVQVQNNGLGLERDKQEQLQDQLKKITEFNKSEHLGLKNVHERIRAFYGEPYGLYIMQLDVEEGFGIYLKLPWDKAQTKGAYMI